ncbi:MAG TPA: ORF6N domain-containing protein [Bryobacteraceae bacterium]|nr:ORF6N domain-containing protein [Bryobacteraceae bacterium]
MIERRIFLIRGQKVIIDSDIAELYQVPTKRLNEAVKRNLSRFPDDFMFQLSAQEADSMRSQIATSNEARGGRRYLPYAFTEQGIAMLSSVLNSDRAIRVNIAIMRAFVRMRELLANHKDLARRIETLEHTQKRHSVLLALVVTDLRDLAKKDKRIEGQDKPTSDRPDIGFRTSGKGT